MSPDEMISKAFGISSFTIVGHLLHINLKEGHLQQKVEIGEALLRQNHLKRVLAVVNKVNAIDNTYRNFDIEVLAKRPDCNLSDEELMICEVNQNKCRFKLDFSKVYWNSRLSTEHERIIAKLNAPHDVVFDAFAGVGPFSVPAAKARCKTFANDLNPESFKWLKINMERNKVNPRMYQVYNKDAKDFIMRDMRLGLLDTYAQIEHEQHEIKPKIHILMNLPALAPSFLPHFIGLLNTEDDKTFTINGKTLINVFRNQALDHIVYCYCFLKGRYEDPKLEVRKIIEENFGREIEDSQLIDIFKVRNVAPFKDMYRVEIRLDEQILFGNPVSVLDKVELPALVPNGNCKKVFLRVEGTKRTLDESLNSSLLNESDQESQTKRAKANEYCSVI